MLGPGDYYIKPYITLYGIKSIIDEEPRLRIRIERKNAVTIDDELGHSVVSPEWIWSIR
jgi:hypothetical protein